MAIPYRLYLILCNLRMTKYVNGCYGNNWKVREFFFGYCVCCDTIGYKESL